MDGIILNLIMNRNQIALSVRRRLRILLIQITDQVRRLLLVIDLLVYIITLSLKVESLNSPQSYFHSRRANRIHNS